MFIQATPRLAYKQMAYWSACVLAVSLKENNSTNSKTK